MMTLPMPLPRMLQDLLYVLCSYLPWPIIIYQCILAPNGLCIVRMSPPILLYFSVLTDYMQHCGHKDAPISRPVLSGSVCIGKTSVEQVIVWMVTQVQAVPQFLGYRLILNDSFWTPAHWGVAL